MRRASGADGGRVRSVHHGYVRPRWHLWWRLTALGFDTLAVAIALGGAAVLRYGPFEAIELVSPQVSSLSAPWLFAVPIWIASFAAFGMYNAVRWANAVDEAKRIAAAGMAAPIGFVVLAFLTRQTPSRFWVLAGSALSIGTVSAGRRGLRVLRNRLRLNGRWMTPTVVVGRYEAKRVIEQLMEDPTVGYEAVGTCGFSAEGLRATDLEYLGQMVRWAHAGAVLVVADDLDREEVQQAVAVADREPASVVLLPGLDYTLAHSLHVVPVGTTPGLAVETPSLKPSQAVVKRAVDIVLSATAIVTLLPFMAFIAAMVRLGSGGSVLFRQPRVGRDGRKFHVLKFRTMVHDADDWREELYDRNEADGLLFKIRDDPRLTGVGRFLRRWSLDELPQLFNVLAGEMSLVGPRPALPDEVENYQAVLTRRLAVRPGMTGLWQIKGRSELPFEEYVRLDLTYVQNWSLLLDIYVLLRTVPAVLTGRGAF